MYSSVSGIQKNNRSRNRKERSAAKEKKINGMIHDAHIQYQILSNRFPKSLEYIDFHHTVMVSYGSVLKGLPGVVTVAINSTHILKVWSW